MRLILRMAKFTIPPSKIWLLFVLDALALTLVRDHIEYGKLWQSWRQFLELTFIHACGIGVLLPVAGACIMTFDKFWLGYKIETKTGNSIEEPMFYVLMTLLVATILVLVGLSVTPSFGED
jgi:hypothetical protein